MRTARLIAAAAGLAALAVPIAPAVAGAQEPAGGKGSASSSATVLDLSLGGGSLLSVRVLGDDAGASTDAVREAFSTLTALAVDAPVDALDVVVQPVDVRSSDGASSKGADARSFDSAAVAGTIAPATLSAVVDETGARSTLESALASLSLAGGILDVDSVGVGTATDVADASSEASRGLSVDGVVLLDLGAVLDGLGMSLGALPVDALVAVAEGLGVDVPGIPDVSDAIASINAAIDELQDKSGNLTQPLCTTVDGALTGGGLPGIGGVLPGVSCDTVDTAEQTVNDTIDGLQAQLAAVVGGLLETLDGAALLSANGVDVGLLAKATGAVDSSTADVQAAIGSISVGGVSLPGVDLTVPLEQVTALADQVTGTVGGVLATIHPDLASLVDVSLLERTSSVQQAGDFVEAAAGLTVARVTVTPPANLAEIVAAVLAAGQSALDTVTDLGGAVPQLSTGVADLEAALAPVLGATVQALSQPTTLTLGSLGVSARHTVAAPAPPAGELPRTGAEAAATAFAGVLLAGAALGIRRWLRATA